MYLEEALREPSPTQGVRVLGLILAQPAAVVAEDRALLAEPAVAGDLTGIALADWVETLLVYKLPRLSREEIRKMLDIFNVELKQTRCSPRTTRKADRKASGRNACVLPAACWT